MVPYLKSGGMGVSVGIFIPGLGTRIFCPTLTFAVVGSMPVPSAFSGLSKSRSGIPSFPRLNFLEIPSRVSFDSTV